MAQPSFIPGIHQYCDRWCERCPFTSRCELFAEEEERSCADEAKRDAANARYLEKLMEMVQDAWPMIRTTAEGMGLDLKPCPEEAANPQAWQAARHGWSDPLHQMAQDYAVKAHRWWEKTGRLLDRDLIPTPQPNWENSNPVSAWLGVLDAVELVCWYQPFIATKLYVVSVRDDDGHITKSRSSPDKNPDGIVKVALIAMDRSIAAWDVLRKAFPQREKTILDFLLSLTRLRTATENAYPNARAFVRPGFDTEPVC